MKSGNVVRIRSIAFAWALLAQTSWAAAAGAARVEDSAKDAVLHCPATSPAQAAARATELEAAKWDKNKLGCAADLWFAQAQATPSSPQVILQALLGAASYIDHVNTLWNYDQYGIRVPEWSARIEHAARQGKQLEAKLAAVPGRDANILAVRAVFKITWPVKIADTRTQLNETREAMKLLDEAVALDPGALDGNALWMLGRLYYDLPEFAGGDSAKALKLLGDAYRRTPGNISLLRYGAYVALQERDLPNAKQRLTALLPIEAPPADLQLMADELKGARELAVRLNDPDLEKRLTDKRDRLLQANPQLLRRQATAANLHGGVDPITGKEY